MSTKGNSLIDWLFPEVRKRVLSLMLTSPQERWYLRDIARRTGCALGAVRRELEGLAGAEILRRRKDGNRVYYQASPDCPILPELSGLMRKTAGLADVIRSALSPIAKHIEQAFIYGSQATGGASASSDVDLLVVGDVDEMVLHRAVGRAEKKLDRPVNYTLLTQREFARRREEKGGFLTRVLKGAKIVVLDHGKEV